MDFNEFQEAMKTNVSVITEYEFANAVCRTMEEEPFCDLFREIPPMNAFFMLFAANLTHKLFDHSHLNKNESEATE